MFLSSGYLTAIACLWGFPERVVGLSVLFLFLFVWLPWGLLSPLMHLACFIVYMAITPPKWKAFRTSRLWDWMRENVYPTRHMDGGVTLATHHPQVFAISPHGIFGEGVHLAFTLTDHFVDVTPVGSSFMTWMPITKDICGLAGMIPANRKDIVHELTVNKKSIFLVPEGIRGILCEGESEKIPRRTGFIACAIEAGAQIVPVYIHGTNQLYTRWPSSKVKAGDSWIRRFQHWMLSTPLRYCFIFVWGKWGGFFPHTGRELRVFYGSPLTPARYPRDDPRFDAHVDYIFNWYTKQVADLVKRVDEKLAEDVRLRYKDQKTTH